MTREEIEKLWLKDNGGRSFGRLLCRFMYEVGDSNLISQWNGVWGSQKHNCISDYYCDDYYCDTISIEDYCNLTYLLRALSLNILLDNNL